MLGAAARILPNVSTILPETIRRCVFGLEPAATYILRVSHTHFGYSYEGLPDLRRPVWNCRGDIP